MPTIKNVEIFKTGSWHGSGGKTTFGHKDLDAMVASWEELGSQPGFVPGVKLGHSESQKFFGNTQGQPRLGFVEKIWREGNKILANFAAVPQALVDLIEKGRYNQVSVEMYPSYEYDGKTFRHLLTAVALLGAELPAVKGLKDLQASLFTEEEAFDVEQEKREFTQEKIGMFTQEQVDSMIEAALLKRNDEVKTEMAEAVAEAEAATAAQSTEIEGLRTENETLKIEKAEFAAQARTAQFGEMIEKAIKEGRVLPKQKDQMLAFAENLTEKVKFGDKEQTNVEAFEEFLTGLPTAVDFNEHSKGKGDETSLNAGEELDAATRALMTEKSIKDYAEARQIVLSENPDLKARYFDNPQA